MGSSKRRYFVHLLLLRDGPGCWICGEKQPKRLSLDHVRPRKYGGTSTLDNLRLACEPCNNEKGHTWPFGEEERKRVLDVLAGRALRACRHSRVRVSGSMHGFFCIDCGSWFAARPARSTLMVAWKG